MDAAELDERREAVIELGAAMRAATGNLVRSKASPEVMHEAALLADRIAALLESPARPPGQLSAIDDHPVMRRFYNPISGEGSPLAPPMTFALDEKGIVCRVTLDERYEGPPLHVHGGITALMFDELFGRAIGATGRRRMTASLEIKYLRPLPLNTELELRARVREVDGRKAWTEGTIALAAEPDLICVESTGLFIAPREEKFAEYFSEISYADGASRWDSTILQAPPA